MWPFKSPVHFQVLKPAGELYYVIRKKIGGQWRYLYHFTWSGYRTDEWSWHVDNPQRATHYATAAEAIEIVKKFPEFDEVVAEFRGASHYP